MELRGDATFSYGVRTHVRHCSCNLPPRMHLRRFAPVAFGLVVASVSLASFGTTGCAAKDDGEDPAITAKREDAQRQYDDDIEWVVSHYETCTIQVAETGKCVIEVPKANGTGTQTITIQSPW